jgi:carbonic anhydrase
MPIVQYILIFIVASLMFLSGCSKSEQSSESKPEPEHKLTGLDDHTPIAPTETHTWSYLGNTGPEHWGELSKEYVLCSKGKEQSPIDLKVSTPQSGLALKFAYQAAPLDSVNNGHTLEQYFPDGQQSMTVNDHVYKLVRLHFHVPSEHTVDGKHTAMEMHIVHQDDQGNAAVLGLLIEPGQSAASMTNLFANLPESPGVHEEKVAVKIDPNDFVPSNHTVWHYKGSLTTPPCSENVQWYVMQTPITISPEHLDSYAKNIIAFDARPVQNLWNRSVEMLKE